VLPMGESVGQHRIYHERLGGRGKPETVTTPAGRYPARRFDHEQKQVSLSYWFSPKKGLVKLVLRIDGVLVLEMARSGEAQWNVPREEPYPAETPGQAWESLGLARKRLDVAALSTLIGEDLWSRLRPASLDIGAQGPERIPPEPVDEIRAVIPQLLDVRFECKGRWGEASLGEARADAVLTARIEGEVLAAEATLIQRKGRDGRWRWTAFSR
jgi:hypothetical protein